MPARRSLSDFAAVCDEHAQLRLILGSLQETIGDPRSNPQVIPELLGELHALLREHFRHEEEGYLAEVQTVAPQLTQRAAELQAQHPAMARQIADLRQLAAQQQHTDQSRQALRDGFAAFLKDFSQHEAAENMLLQEAFQDDMGAED